MKKSLLTLITIPLLLVPRKVSNSDSSFLIDEKQKSFYEQTITSNFAKLKEIQYKKDSEVYGWNYWQSPSETEKLKTGDCEDKSIYFQDLLNKGIIETKLVWGKMLENDTVEHIWLEYALGNRDYIIECSRGGRIFSRDTLNHRHYITSKIKWSKKSKIREYEKRNKTKLNFKYVL